MTLEQNVIQHWEFSWGYLDIVILSNLYLGYFGIMTKKKHTSGVGCNAKLKLRQFLSKACHWFP